MSVGHTLILGQTESGKTTLAKRMATQYVAAGITPIVLDRTVDPGWPTDFIFKYSANFLAYVKDASKCMSCALFVDESGMSLDKYDSDTEWLTTTARHHGHRTHLLAHRAEMVNTNVRSQCATLICFALNIRDAKEYSLMWNCEEIKQNAPRLEHGQYMCIRRFHAPTYHRLWTTPEKK